MANFVQIESRITTAIERILKANDVKIERVGGKANLAEAQKTIKTLTDQLGVSEGRYAAEMAKLKESHALELKKVVEQSVVIESTTESSDKKLEMLEAEKQALTQTVASLRGEIEATNAIYAKRRKRYGNFRNKNMALRKLIEELKNAQEKSINDPSLVNKALQFELDSMTLDRKREVEELDYLLSQLDPIAKGEMRAGGND